MNQGSEEAKHDGMVQSTVHKVQPPLYKLDFPACLSEPEASVCNSFPLY
jgi:hypothetical protein